MECQRGKPLNQSKGNTMHTHIFGIRDNLKIFGFHYVLWLEGLGIRTLYNIWIAYGMIRHESAKNN
jgi:hypothetical protein